MFVSAYAFQILSAYERAPRSHGLLHQHIEVPVGCSAKVRIFADNLNAIVIARESHELSVLAIPEAPTSLSRVELDKLKDVDSVSKLQSWQNNVPGIWTVLLIVGNRVYLRTDLMRSSTIYVEKSGSAVIYANMPEAILNGTETASATKASLGLLYPGSPISVDYAPLTENLAVLDPGCVYSLDRSGYHLVSPMALPDPTAAIKEHKSLIRSSLRSAVFATVGERLGADLSGGFDSTTLCYILNQSGSRFDTFTGSSVSGAAQDGDWAERALGDLKFANPHRWRVEDLPLCFSASSYRSSIPFAGISNASKICVAAQRAKSTGVDVLLGGHGGDELFDIDENSLFNHPWRNPFSAIRNARAYSANYRWAKRDILKAIFFPEAPSRIISSHLGSMRKTPDTLSFSPNRWMLSAWYLPSWASKEAEREVIQGIEALAKSRWRTKTWSEKLHQIVSDSASVTRHIRWIYKREGVALRTPYLDESVFRSVCSLNPIPIANPDQFKCALTSSMEGDVPPTVYQRGTKDVGLADVYTGWEQNKVRMSRDIESWELAKLGLVDVNRLRSVIERKIETNTQPIALWRTIAVEQALRGLKNETE